MRHDFESVIRERRTIRDFRPDPIDETTLRAIFDDARYAPSWSNTRPYCVAVATGDRLDRLRAAYVAEFNASLGLQRGRARAIVKAIFTRGFPDGDFVTWKPKPSDLRERSAQNGKALYRHIGIAREDYAARDDLTRKNFELFGAPVGVWLFAHQKMMPFSALDSGLMLSSLMLSAQAHGVSSCALGALATWRRPIDQEFELPPHYKLMTGLALGYASSDSINEFRADHPGLIQASVRTRTSD